MSSNLNTMGIYSVSDITSILTINVKIDKSL
jgi:hypothetical protein